MQWQSGAFTKGEVKVGEEWAGMLTIYLFIILSIIFSVSPSLHLVLVLSC